MNFIEQVGTRYLEGKAYAAPQQIENFAKKQFFRSTGKAKPPNGNVSAADEQDEPGEHGATQGHDRVPTKKANKGQSERGAASEKDLEIARLRGQLEESRRGAAREASSHTPAKKNEQKAAAANTESPSRKLGRSRSTKLFDDKGIKVVGGALVADAASRRHREKRPEHGGAKDLGKTVDGKAVGIAGGALVAEKRSKARSKSAHAAKEPIIVDAAPRARQRRRRRSVEEEDSEEEEEDVDEDSEDSDDEYDTVHYTPNRRRPPPRHRSRDEDEQRGLAQRTINQRARRRSLEDTRTTKYDSNPPSRATRSRRSFAAGSEQGNMALTRTPSKREKTTTTQTAKSEAGSTTAPLSRPPKSILSPRSQRRPRSPSPSPSSATGSTIAPPKQVEAIRRRQRSRGRGLTDAEIDTPAPETPSLRALSRRRREVETRHERGGDQEEAHLPERRKSILHERVGGEGAGGDGGGGSVIDVLEASSVAFRPKREGRRSGGGDGGGGYSGPQGEGGYNSREEKARARERGRKGGRSDIVEVMEEDSSSRAGPVVRRIDMGGGGEGGGGERSSMGPRSEVELMRKEGGRTVYRVR